ncbi:hypothetical protein QQ045_025080 [Rhodiola kirilowii]
MNVPSQSTLNPNMDADDIINPGPIDDSIRTRQKTHRTEEIWNNSKDPKMYKSLRVKHVTMDPPNERIMQYIATASFYPWSIVCNVKSNPRLVTALVERWRPETHTFHFNGEEATVTLQDVALLTGLPIEGRLVTGHAHLTWPPNCMRLLGDYPECHKESPSLAKKTWFNDNMSIIPADADEEMLKRYARAYILQLLGECSAGIFVQYALQSQQSGKWHGPKDFIGVPKGSLLFYRDEFQKMQITDFIWRPYDGSFFHLLNPICVEGQNSWRVDVPLIHFNVIEWHHPERVMRQFGCRQFIPLHLIDCSDENHANDRKPKVDWGVHHYRYLQLWFNRFQNIVDREASDSDIASTEYYGWYSMITRRLFQPRIDEVVDDAVVV